MDFYSEEEIKLMAEYQCWISKIFMSMDGVAHISAFAALDEAVSRIVKDDPYIERRTILNGAIQATVVSFMTESGMGEWLRRFPSDIQFIEKDWGG